MGWLSFGKKREMDEPRAPTSIREVTESDELLSMLAEGLAIVYKHSNRCALCFRTLKEVQKFAQRHPDIPVFMIDVVRNRAISNLIAKEYDVVHQSPQALVIREGVPVWHASHLSITLGELEGAIV